MKKLTLLLLCRGRKSKVLTLRVRLAMALPPIDMPVRVAPDEMMAAPPAPARKPLVPVTPTVVRAAPRPAPMTGARRPAERPMTSPPPAREERSARPNESNEKKRLTERRQAHHHVSRLLALVCSILQHLGMLLVGHALLNFERLRQPPLEPHDVNPCETELVGDLSE